MKDDAMDASVARLRRPEPPPFNPDIELIDHGEGSRWWRRYYRKGAVELRDRLQRERAERQAARLAAGEESD